MSAGPRILGIQLFHNLALKVQDQDLSSRSRSGGFKIFTTHIIFVPCQSPSHSRDTVILKFDLENPRSRSRERSISQSGFNFLSTHIPFIPCQSVSPLQGYIFFKIWPWKSKVKVIAQDQVMGPTSYRLTSLLFHVNWPSHSYTAFSKFDLENWRSRSWERSSSKPQSVTHFLSIHIPFVLCQSVLLFLCYSFFNIWPWKSKVKVISQWCCTTTGLYISIELGSGVNPSRGFRVCRVWTPVVPDLTSFGSTNRLIWDKLANYCDITQQQV